MRPRWLPRRADARPRCHGHCSTIPRHRLDDASRPPAGRLACRSSPRRAAANADTPVPATAADATLIAATNTAVGHMGRYDFQAAVDCSAAWPPRIRAPPRPPSISRSPSSTGSAPTTRPRRNGACARCSSHPAVGMRARYALGLLLLYQGRDAEAFPLLTAVAAAMPVDPFPAYFAGQARLAAAPAEALPWFEKARTRSIRSCAAPSTGCSRPGSVPGRPPRRLRPSNASRHSTPIRARTWRSSATRAWGRWPRPWSSRRRPSRCRRRPGPCSSGRPCCCSPCRLPAGRLARRRSWISTATARWTCSWPGAATEPPRIWCCSIGAALGRRRPPIRSAR